MLGPMQMIKKRHKKGQATTELAIMGALMIIILSELVSVGYFNNMQLGLEMYTYREALRLSKGLPPRTVGDKNLPSKLTLTVFWDMFKPSFFTGLERQRLSAVTSVDLNTNVQYMFDAPQDAGEKQLIQIGDAMIQNGVFLEVPPTKIRPIKKEEYDKDNDKEKELQDYADNSTENDEKQGWVWARSAQLPLNPYLEGFVTDYDYNTTVTETGTDKTVQYNLTSDDWTPVSIVKFQSKDEMKSDYNNTNDEWQNDDDPSRTVGAAVAAKTIPKDIIVGLKEKVVRNETIHTTK